MDNNTNTYYSVGFKGHRRDLFVNLHDFQVNKNDKVIVELETGMDIGCIMHVKNCAVHRENINSIVRIATEQDLDKDFLNRYDEEDVVFKAANLVSNLCLDMKIVDAEWQFDRQKLTIFFTSPTRVDFRELIKELARQFRTRIELRQINSREETKRLGCGIGCCGQTICCTSFLFDFNQVTIDHAKVQQLSNNVTKLSGNCGRLKCCLLFEYEHYSEELEKYPPLNSIIAMEGDNAVINKIDIFKAEVTVFNLKQKKNVVLSFKDLTGYIKAGKITPPELSIDESLKKIVAEENIVIDEF